MKQVGRMISNCCYLMADACSVYVCEVMIVDYRLNFLLVVTNITLYSVISCSKFSTLLAVV